MRARSKIAVGAVLAAAAAAAVVTGYLRAAPAAARAADACFNPLPEPPGFWMGPVVGCTCAEREMTDDERTAGRLEAEARVRRKADLEARILALLSEESTHRSAAIACWQEGDRCEPDSAWRQPLYCLGRGRSAALWRERARLHEKDAESVALRLRALAEEQSRLAISACCDHVYLNP